MVAIYLMLLFGFVAGKQCKDDPAFSCDDTQTCCLLPAGQGIGCCPYRNAVCCQDRLHCCPEGLECDIKAGRCVGNSYKLLLQKLDGAITNPNTPKTKLTIRKPQKSSSSFLSVLANRKSCPDKSYSCEVTQTCCPLDLG
ncbi:granulins [Eurytemora carolleeae]|uniref:granulins n=1 Tax=Eurytemora carolleeae TaxID=1294199 RepID=UPI000C771E2D|nr:granulins [Eurytemora carolleeae]|eukprot:XP_023329802.1 granulins-like [Eurytemora affinis]